MSKWLTLLKHAYLQQTLHLSVSNCLFLYSVRTFRSILKQRNRWCGKVIHNQIFSLIILFFFVWVTPVSSYVHCSTGHICILYADIVCCSVLLLVAVMLPLWWIQMIIGASPRDGLGWSCSPQVCQGLFLMQIGQVSTGGGVTPVPSLTWSGSTHGLVWIGLDWVKIFRELYGSDWIWWDDRDPVFN